MKSKLNQIKKELAEVQSMLEFAPGYMVEALQRKASYLNREKRRMMQREQKLKQTLRKL